MGAEALQLVLGLERHTEFVGRVWITSFADIDSYEVFAGLPQQDQAGLLRMLRGGQRASLADARAAVIVCHSEPGAWALPEPLYQTALCPPVPVAQAARVVARAMFETDRLSAEHVRRCNQMHEVWVPTEFHRRTFAASGVQHSRLQVVPEPVDVHAFDPARHAPLPLPLGTRVFGPAWPHAPAPGGDGGADSSGVGGGKPFVFLSIFKWETRKGWDVLLRAFLTEFTAADNVLLLLHTKPFHSEPDFPQQMQDWVRRELPAAAERWEQLPSVYVTGEHIQQVFFPRLYRSADAFVLPTRGEGWGLPVVEAMAMELPVIVTNFSGPTAYLSEDVGYPLRYDLADVPAGTGAFSGHRWAQPSAEHLAQLMRHVVQHQEEAAQQGKAARRLMAERFSPAAVAEAVARQLRRIERELAEQQQGEQPDEAEL
ncbi:hypothetical protein ABPG75_007456 [Micractinium tetrahymenae]